MFIRVAAVALVSLLGVSMLSGARAEWSPYFHPRISQVDRRLASQRYRVFEGVEHGRITPWQAARDQAAEARIYRQMRREQAWNGGYITQAQQRQLNRELNRNGERIYDQSH